MADQPCIWVLNGPNLNLLGTREPDIYGRTTLAQIEKISKETAATVGYDVDFRQTNHEGELVTWIQQAGPVAAAMVLNAGALTHTSVAVHDALMTVRGPVIEVHISNIHAREPFRRRSYVSGVATGVICGLGPYGYVAAINAIAGILDEKVQ